nr:type III-B CRISPR module-associated protein Cmr3 [Thermococcus chitonophagus]
MFREPKPFDTDHHLARTTLPLPQTVAGAIRSKLFLKYEAESNNKAKNELKNLIWNNGKEDSEEPGFELLGLFFSKVPKDYYFPVPFDIVKDKDGNTFTVKPMPLKLPGVEGKHIFSGQNIHFEPMSGYIPFEALKEYLAGTLPKSELKNTVIHESRLYVRENRIGIRLTSSKVVRKGLFYRVEMLRLREDVELVAWVRDSAVLYKYLGQEGTLKLGGEGRFARYIFEGEKKIRELTEFWKKKVKPKIQKSGRFKLYLATPAIFEEDSKYHAIPTDTNVKVVAQIVGKPIPVSGWDMKSRKPKATRYLVPAGSVYFVEGDFEGDFPWIKIGSLTKLGYGLAFVGVW